MKDTSLIKRKAAELERSGEVFGEGFMDGGTRMRLPKRAHTSRPWRIHEIAPDFDIEDVWALPTPGGPEDFPRLVRQMSSGGPSFSGAARALWKLRSKLGAMFGWDSPEARPDRRTPTLRERLPDDLRGGPTGPEFDALPFTSLYLLEDEFAAEIVNRTVHGIMHLGWVSDGAGGFRGQMAVLEKPNGIFGAAYMAAIKPFRRLIVYPALMRMIGREWRADDPMESGNSKGEVMEAGSETRSVGVRPEGVVWRRLPAAALLAAAIAGVANAVVFFVASAMGFISPDVLVPAAGGEFPITAGVVVAASVAGAVAATLVYAGIGFFSKRPARVFAIVSAVVLAASLATPPTLDAPISMILTLEAMHIVAGAAIVGALTTMTRKGDSMYSSKTENDASRRDAASIEKKVAELERAQRNEDVDGFISLFTPEAVWVTAHGKRLTGRDEIHDFTKKVLPGAMKDSTARYEVVHVSFVRDDVAVVNVRQTPISHGGDILDGVPHGSPVYVMAKEGGEWRISAAQNTHIKEA